MTHSSEISMAMALTSRRQEVSLGNGGHARSSLDFLVHALQRVGGAQASPVGGRQGVDGRAGLGCSDSDLRGVSGSLRVRLPVVEAAN